MKTLLLALSLSSQSLFAGTIADHLVKMMSYPCDRPARARFGSGIWLEAGARLYVLSSDHVVFHGDAKEGICHKAYRETDRKEVPLHLVMVHFGRGLSLLVPARSITLEPGAAISFEELIKAETERPEGFGILAGYPFSSGGVNKDDNAQILNSASDRTILPSVPTVMEVSGANEYGMSGGGFFDGRGRYRGLLSHQYLQVEVGKPTRIYDTGEAMTGGKLIGLVIPLPTIVGWLRPYFAAGAQDDLRLDLAAQLHKKAAVSLDGIHFTPRPAALTSNAAHGGDPVGVGGDESDGGKALEIVLSLERPGIATQAWPFAPAPWLRATKERLSSGGAAVITGLLRNGARYPIGNLVNLFSKLGRGFVPMIRITAPFIKPDEATDRLLQLAKSTSPLLIEARGRYEDPDAQELCQELALVLELVENRQFELIDLSDVRRLISASAWTQMMIEDLNLATQLKAHLLQMQEQLKKVKI